MGIVEAALAYARMGYRVLPVVSGGKRPVGFLVPRGLRDATVEEEVIRRWWERVPEAGVGLLPPASVLVLDYDNPALWEEHLGRHGFLEAAPRQRTPRGGVHVFLRLFPGVRLRARAGGGLDLRGMDRAYVVVWPTPGYVWEVPLVSPGELPLVSEGFLREVLGEYLLEKLADKAAKAPEGRRHNTLVAVSRAAGGLVAHGVPVERVMKAMERAGLASGLDEKEVEAAVEWGVRVGVEEPLELPLERKMTKRALAEAIAERVAVWRGNDGAEWCTVDGEHMPVRGQEFEAWVVQVADEVFGDIPSSEMISSVRRFITARALRAPMYPVYRRVAPVGDAVYVDLGTPDRDVVVITPEGWEVRRGDIPVRFRRNALSPLPMPERPQGVEEAIRWLDEFLGLMPLQGVQRPLLTGWLLGLLNPIPQYPVLVLTGEKGAGKTTVARAIVKLLEPHMDVMVIANQDGLLAAAYNNYVIGLDNLSSIPKDLSDWLCVMSTGGQMVKRQLYTDSGQNAVEVRRPVVLTGIALEVLRDDLADRAVLLSLSRIADEDRCTESVLWSAYRGMHARVLGALFTLAVEAMRARSEVEREVRSVPRLADWVLFVEGVSPLLGLRRGEFAEEVFRMQGLLSQEVMDLDPVANALVMLAEEMGPGERRVYTTQELLDRLEEVMGIRDARVKPMGWPKSATALARHLPRLQSGLRVYGVRLGKTYAAHEKRTVWVLERVVKADVVSQAAELTPPEFPTEKTEGDDRVWF